MLWKYSSVVISMLKCDYRKTAKTSHLRDIHHSFNPVFWETSILPTYSFFFSPPLRLSKWFHYKTYILWHRGLLLTFLPPCKHCSHLQSWVTFALNYNSCGFIIYHVSGLFAIKHHGKFSCSLQENNEKLMSSDFEFFKISFCYNFSFPFH